MKTNSKSISVSKSTLETFPAHRIWHPAQQTSTFMVGHKKLPKSRMIGKALLSGLSAPGGLFPCPFHLDLSHDSSCFTVRLTF